jgi:hypothetical protein
MRLFQIAARVAARVAGEVWNLGPGDLESEARKLTEEAGEDDVKNAIVSSFDKAFNTNYSKGEVPFFSSVEELSIEDLFHELLHHAISPKKYTDYASSIEGAFHEHIIRGYQSSLDSAESIFTAFEELGFDGNKYHKPEERMPKEEADKFLAAFQTDVEKSESPEIKPLLQRALKRIEAIIRRGGDDGPIGADINKEMEYIEKQAHEMEGQFIPAGTEERVREWYRWLAIAFRQLRDD